jgi:hypothetical protein
MSRLKKRMAVLAACTLLAGAGAWAANDPDARFAGGTHDGYDVYALLGGGRTKGGTHAGYDVFAAEGIKLQVRPGTVILVL